MCLIDRDSSIPQTGAVELLNGGLRFLFVAHFDKSKAFASPGIVIGDDRDCGDLSGLFEQSDKILFGRLIGESPLHKFA
jgi:hypothetical protein